jgi:cyanophycinase
MPGRVVLVGGGEWLPGCEVFDRPLVEAAGGEVALLPTAAAFERPDRALQTAASYFEGLGARVRPIEVLVRRDAMDPVFAEAVRSARLVYLGGGSPLHLRSVLKGSLVWEALRAAWQAGATVAGSSAGAMVLGDPMVDPRGGALTLGLGLIERLAVLPHADTLGGERLKRTLELAGPGVRVVSIPERSALLREPDGSWRMSGAGRVHVHLDGVEAGLDVLD